MAFDLERFFTDVFAPRPGEIVTVTYDVPHAGVADNQAWRDRRQMAKEWHLSIAGFATTYGMRLNPLLTYESTGSHNSDLPETGRSDGKTVRLEEVIASSTVVISMPEYSASAPLAGLTQKYAQVRVASMPGVSKSMESTGLSADYRKVAERCARLAPLFERAIGVEVIFSTGHSCYFDLSDNNPVFQDNGLLPPAAGSANPRSLPLRNLPSGEVCTCPNESAASLTSGAIPAAIEGEIVVFLIEHNRIVDVEGKGPVACKERRRFQQEAALCNIAEVAIGCNEQAAVTGNALEDEKAGFHWAFGRSEHLGGTVGPASFSSPDKVIHEDIVYAKGSPIECERLDFIFPDGTRTTAIRDGLPII